ncbi:hypothetical protein HCN56_00245 [Streptomyces lonarensis]|uniref:DUF8175 domain-containing protein n=1 Tax=Streptomyces lonarensis TaxID=700599 RepID=A0A7X6CX46_9ACTN|nr:hypothetical protein [Streptomyces lonarensis]
MPEYVQDAVSSERPRVVNGVPVGHPRTEAGAKAAAANYVTTGGSTDVLTKKAARHRALSVMAADSAKETLTAKADRDAKSVADALQGDSRRPDKAIARTAVLSTHVLGHDEDEAMMRLWTTNVRGNLSGPPPTAAFESVTVTLVWESGDWKLHDMSRTTGLVTPIDVRQASNVAEDFSDYVATSASDPVLSGSTGDDGFPAGYAREEVGAQAAAVSAVMLYGDPRFFADSTWRSRMLAATAAPSVLDSAMSDAEATGQLVAENRGLGTDGKTRDGSELITRTAVLATRTIAQSRHAASVELWTASVGGFAGSDEAQRPQIGFLRMTVDLVWSDGTWKTTAVTPSEPLVPAPPALHESAPAERFAGMGGASHAPALA